jgi:hypothetical protein
MKKIFTILAALLAGGAAISIIGLIPHAVEAGRQLN